MKRRWRSAPCAGSLVTWKNERIENLEKKGGKGKKKVTKIKVE
jgi:hypothetical protein